MISPHTAPGTKVVANACGVRFEHRVETVARRRFFGLLKISETIFTCTMVPGELEPGKTYTVSAIVPVAGVRMTLGIGAVLAEVHDRFVDLTLLDYRALPSCLTDILKSAPVDHSTSEPEPLRVRAPSHAEVDGLSGSSFSSLTSSGASASESFPSFHARLRAIS